MKQKIRRIRGTLVLVVLVTGLICFSLGTVKDASAEVSPKVQKIINNAYLMNMPAEKLPPLVVQALSRYQSELSNKQMDIAYSVFKNQIGKIGPGKMVVGIADGFGDNVWRQLVLMEVILQSMTHSDIGKVIYTNAHGKMEEAVANMRSLIAQQVDLIVAYLDHGDAMLPTIKEAMDNGIPVVPYIANPPNGKPGEDYTCIIEADRKLLGKRSAEKAVALVGKKGTALFLGGTPGNPSSFHEHEGCMAVFSKYPGWKVLQADTNWTRQGVFEAVSGVLATGKKIDAIIYDYANAARGIFRAYQQAGVKKLPVIIADGADNGFFKDCKDAKSKDPKFKGFSCASNTWYSRVAVTAGLDAKKGKKITNTIQVPMPLFEVKGDMYDPSLPEDYGFPLLPRGIVMKMFPE